MAYQSDRPTHTDLRTFCRDLIVFSFQSFQSGQKLHKNYDTTQKVHMPNVYWYII